MSIYSSIINAKNNTEIPLFASGRSMESKYNPQNEAQRIVEASGNFNFYIVLGIGSGILIKLLSEKNPKAFIIGVEKSQDDLKFLERLDSIKELKNNNQVILIDYSLLNEVLLKNYLPAYYGNLKIIEQRAWIQENIEIKSEIEKIIQESLKQISRDFSVQAHFGKIWHSNILKNIKLYSSSTNPKYKLEYDNSKTAAIIAAGPSLDKSICELKNNRDKYVIFATDTAYSPLIKAGIIPEFVISIDGQNISHSHFIQDKKIFRNSLFICDLCSDFSANKNILKNGGRLLFSVSGHPLSEYFYEQNPGAFIKLYSGAGTVTIAAVDAAIKAGMKKIQIFAADFAYLEGKAYAKGTYLDPLYSKKSNKLFSLEKQFDTLLFRTELEKIENNSYTTQTLEAYKESLENYLKEKQIQFIIKDHIYYLENTKKAYPDELSTIISPDKNIYADFRSFIENYQKKEEINSIKDLNILEIALLPLISWLRFYDNKENDFTSLLEKAYKFVKRD